MRKTLLALAATALTALVTAAPVAAQEADWGFDVPTGPDWVLCGATTPTMKWVVAEARCSPAMAVESKALQTALTAKGVDDTAKEALGPERLQRLKDLEWAGWLPAFSGGFYAAVRSKDGPVSIFGEVYDSLDADTTEGVLANFREGLDAAPPCGAPGTETVLGSIAAEGAAYCRPVAVEPPLCSSPLPKARPAPQKPTPKVVLRTPKPRVTPKPAPTHCIFIPDNPGAMVQLSGPAGQGCGR